MKTALRRSVTTVVMTVGVVAMVGGPALAHQCINASKAANGNHEAGAQVVFGPDDEIVSITKGLEKRIEKGIVDPETGEGFHGILAWDEDGDGTADGHTYIVGPEAQIPETAQQNGPDCKGITDIPTYYEQCLDD